MKTKLYTVANFAKIYKSKNGGACHRNNIYHLIDAGKLPKGTKHIVLDGKNFIKVSDSYLENQGITEID